MSDADEQLDAIAKVLRDNPDAKIEIGGHADAPGSTRTNARLSKQRADNVRQALIDRGIESTRITTKGYGEQDPAEKTSGESVANRRVDVRVMHRG